MIRNAIVHTLAHFDIRPTVLRFPTEVERSYIRAAYRIKLREDVVHADLAAIRNDLSIAVPAHGATALEKLYTHTIDELVRQEKWSLLKRLLGKMYERDHYHFAEAVLEHIAELERHSPLPDEVLAISYRVPKERLHEFTDACISIDALAKLMNAMVHNKRWDAVNHFLRTAKKRFRSGARLTLARVVMCRGKESVPERVFQQALKTDPIIQVRSVANIDLQWIG